MNVSLEQGVKFIAALYGFQKWDPDKYLEYKLTSFADVLDVLDMDT